MFPVRRTTYNVIFTAGSYGCQPLFVGVSSFMGYLKGKSSLMIYEKYPELRYKYRNREFWCRGYYVDTAGKKRSMA